MKNLNNAETQYLDLMKRIIYEGKWVHNSRTNTNCLTVLNGSITMQADEVPILTTRKINWKGAFAEMLCYMRGYTDLEDFHKLGCKTWDSNALAWNKEGKSVGLIYGASSEAVGVSYQNVLEKIINNPTDRGHIWNFWNPALFNKGCLRPCMFNHQFNVINDTIHLTSTQRSSDVPLGESFNMLQAWFLLKVTSNITGYKAGTTTINITNAHIYENQLDLAKEHIKRTPTPCKPEILGLDKFSWKDLINQANNPLDKLEIVNYEYQRPIKYPFTT